MEDLSKARLVATVLAFFVILPAWGSQADELADLRKVIETQQKQLEALADAIESQVEADGTRENRTTLGGYGELHYNDLDSGRDIDFHRFVLFFSHEFSHDVSFHAELELEHSIAGDDQVGEIELEQAFIQWDYASGHHLKAGLFLIPVGFINESHEPDIFYGVERNVVERNIIPTTWWEGGLAVEGEMAPGWTYDLSVHSGLNLDTDDASAGKRSSIRSARQKVGKANADSMALTGRLRYNGIPGFRWALAFQYQEDLTQDDADGVGVQRIDARLLETDISYQNGPFNIKFLYALWDLDEAVNQLNPGADEQSGWYLEPSWRINDQWGVFARYSEYDLTSGSSLTSNEQSQWDLGFNFWLHERVVFKFDYQKQRKDTGAENDGFNLGVGYSF